MFSFFDWCLASVSSASLVSLVILLLRNVITTRLTASVQHEFNDKIEVIKSQLRTTEESFKAELRKKESQIETLTNGALSAMASRQITLDKRRIEAIEQLWCSVNKLAPARNVASTMAFINFDAALKETAKSQKARSTFEVMIPIDLNSIEFGSGWVARPFVSTLAWALYSAYIAILGISVGKMKQLQIGVEGDFFDNKGVCELVRTALPHHEAYITKFGAAALPQLLAELESCLLLEFNRMLIGTDSDVASVEKAAEIMKATSLLMGTGQSKDLPR